MYTYFITNKQQCNHFSMHHAPSITFIYSTYNLNWYPCTQHIINLHDRNKIKARPSLITLTPTHPHTHINSTKIKGTHVHSVSIPSEFDNNKKVQIGLW